MRRICVPLAICLALSWPASAQTPVSARTIRAGSIVTAEDIAADQVTLPEAIALIGLEARVTVYAGRPLRAGDFGAPRLIERNQLVALVYRRGSLSIQAEGRALGQGGVGDSLRILNVASRTTVTGVIQSDGTVSVLPSP